MPVRRQLRLQQMTVLNIFSLFSEKMELDISCESSARQKIHLKHQAFLSSEDKNKKKIKVVSAAISLNWLFKG